MNWRDWDAICEGRSRGWDPGSICDAIAARKWWLIGPPLAVLLLIAGLLGLEPARYSADAQVLIGPRTGGLTGLRSSLAALSAMKSDGPAAGQAQLIASRDLARRAIKDLGIESNPEFDPVIQSSGAVSQALIFLGVLRDPARESAEDRILDAYLEHLQVSAQGRGSVVRITFQSEDRELAVKAANHIAELYIEMRARANALPHNGEAHIVSRAITPLKPLCPKKALLLLSGAALTIVAFAGFAGLATARRRLPPRSEEPVEQPRALGQVRVFARLGYPARRAEPSGEGMVLDPPRAGNDGGGAKEAVVKIIERVLSARSADPGVQGTRIVATGLGSASAASDMLRDFARGLAREGRSIVVGLDGSSLFDSDVSASGPRGGDAAEDDPGLSELLNGTASFGEVIRRDPASRLHFLPAGRGEELNLAEFAQVLDALAEIYDFLLVIAPPLHQDRSGVAETLAAGARFTVVASPFGTQGGYAFEAETRLKDAGAREVLLIGVPAALRSLSRDAA